MASAIPPVLVELQLETANLKKGLGQLNQNFSNFGETVKKQTSFMSNFKSAAVGVFAGNVMTQGLQMLKSGIQAAITDAREFERVTAQLQAGLVSTGNVAGLSVAGIQAHASALEELSGVDENLILQSQAVFQTFTNIRNVVGEGNDIFDQASLAALDLSTKLGGDLQGATIQLGKALNDPIKGITALSRVGVAFSTQQKEQIKVLVESGDVLGAQKIILNQMQTEYGGAAKAAGDTFAGAVARAKDKVADFTRDLITNLQPILLSIGKAVGDLITKYVTPFLKLIKDNKEALLLFVGVLASAYVAFKLYGVILGVVKAAQTLYAVGQVILTGGQLASIASTNGLAASMLRLNAIMRANPIGVIVTAIALLAAGFVIAWNKSETFRKVVVEVAKGVLSYVAFMIRAWGGLIEIILKVVSGPLRLFLGVMSKLPGIGDAAKKGLDLINNGIEGVGDFADKTASKIEGFKTTLDGLKDKKIKIPGFGGSGKADDPTGAEAPGGGLTADQIKKAKADAKERLKLIESANKDVIKTYASMDKVIYEAQLKVAEAGKRRDESIMAAKKKNVEAIAKAEVDLLEATTKAYKRNAEAIAKAEVGLLEATNKAYKRNAEQIETANRDYAKRTLEIEARLQERITSLREAAANKAADLVQKAADKQQSIIQQSMDRLRTAFSSKTGFSLVDSFAEGKSAEKLLSDLKGKLGAVKNLAENAAFLQANGFTQTFIEQVVSAGPEVGNKLAEAILNASPESIKELQATFGEMETVSISGLDDLAKTMNSGGKLATKQLMDAYAQVSVDLKASLTEVNTELTKALAEANTEYAKSMVEAKAMRDEKLAEAAKDLLEALAEADKDYKATLAEAAKDLLEALAEADKDYKATLAETAKNLAETLADIQTTYNDAIDEIARQTAEKIADLQSKLVELAETLKALGEKQAALNVLKNAPIYTPPNAIGSPVAPLVPSIYAQGGRIDSSGDYNAFNPAMVGGMTSQGRPTAAPVVITQNITYPTASAAEISAQTLSAIKFGSATE